MVVVVVMGWMDGWMLMERKGDGRDDLNEYAAQRSATQQANYWFWLGGKCLGLL